MRRGFVIALALGIFATVSVANPSVVHAQFGLGNLDASVLIKLSPTYPEANAPVRLTAVSSVLDLSQSTLTWDADGKTIAQGVGAIDADITTKGIGEATAVGLNVIAPDGTLASAEVRIIPSRIDLFFSSDSYVPPFYRGRALPSAGSHLILETKSYFFLPDGTRLPEKNLVYTWKKNGQVMGQYSGKGRSSITIPAPVLYAHDTISVTVASADGLLANQASLAIPVIDPPVVLYEDHPLFGVRFGQALGASASIPESEMTFLAVPYFAPVRSINDPALEYAWRVNGAPISPNAKTPSSLTIDASGSSGEATISLDITHATNYFLDANGSWNVAFSVSGAKSGDPFSAPQ